MLDNKYYKYYKDLEIADKYRQLRDPDLLADSNLAASKLDFSTNDYLNLSNNQELLAAAYAAALQYGVGSTGSRLLSGNKKIFSELEYQIALDKGTESALIFNSGFQANITVLSSLLDSKVLGGKPLVFFDKLNHASLYQAVFLSNPQLIRYRHNDLQHLSDLLSKFSHINVPKFIVTETVFGMDGDVLLLNELLNIANYHKAFVYLDEAHATGVIGKTGYGLAAKLDFNSDSYVVMGTFSKALGCAGAYIATSNNIKNYLINKAPGFIYSTANSPMLIGAVLKAWNIIKTMEQHRKILSANAAYLRKNLTNLGFNIGLSSTHIIPIILGEEKLAMHIKQYLNKHDIIVSCIRPPTVRSGTSRLRIALTLKHNLEDLNKLISVFKQL